MNYKYSGYVASSASFCPNTAVLLSLIPGLGQLYVGERRKGILFLDVAAVNFALLWMMLFADPIVKFLTQFGSVCHIHLNVTLLHVLGAVHLGTPASSLLLSAIVLFVVFAAHDAYRTAVSVRRQKIYPDQLIDLSEATSGAYLFHFALMTLCVFLSMFYLLPAPPVRQITEFTFIDNVQPPVKEKVDSRTVSQNKSVAQGKFDKSKPVSSNASHASPAKEDSAVAQRLAAVKPPEAPHPVTQSQPAHSQATPQPVKPTMARQLPQPQLPAPPIPARPPQPAPPMPTRSSQPVPSSNAAKGSTPMPLAAQPIRVAQALPPVAPLLISRTGSLPVPAAAPSGNMTPSTVPGISAPRVITSVPGSSHQPVPVSRTAAGPSTGPASNVPVPTRVASQGQGTGTQFGQPAVAVMPSNAVGPGQASSQNQGTGSNASPNTREGVSTPESSVAEFGPYMAALQKRIRKNWFPPHGDTRRVVVIFKIHQGGLLSNLRIEHSSGMAMVDNAALTAVNNSAPFPELPPHAPADVDIQFTFDYNVFGGHSGTFRQF